jgi:hypothetical protein
MRIAKDDKEVQCSHATECATHCGLAACIRATDEETNLDCVRSPGHGRTHYRRALRQEMEGHRCVSRSWRCLELSREYVHPLHGPRDV